jgi:hypothetical protein
VVLVSIIVPPPLCPKTSIPVPLRPSSITLSHYDCLFDICLTFFLLWQNNHLMRKSAQAPRTEIIFSHDCHSHNFGSPPIFGMPAYRNPYCMTRFPFVCTPTTPTACPFFLFPGISLLFLLIYSLTYLRFATNNNFMDINVWLQENKPQL